jgi:hypothetical protein
VFFQFLKSTRIYISLSLISLRNEIEEKLEFKKVEKLIRYDSKKVVKHTTQYNPVLKSG